MKQFIIFFAALLLAPALHAQNDLGKSDDLARIALSAYVPDNAEGVPEGARDYLKNKLRQIAMTQGLANDFGDSRFVISGKVVQVQMIPQAGAPMLYVAELDLTVYVGDGIEGTLFSQTTKSIKGIGDTETKAYIDALKKVQVQDPAFTEMLETGKTKIIEYYNANCDMIIQKAMSQSGQENYDEALYTLGSVPSVCAKCYEFANEAAVSVYKAKQERDCRVSMAQARAAMNVEDFKGAASALATGIGPGAACFEEATKLMDEIVRKADATEGKREWELEKKKWDDNVDIEKKRIDANVDVAKYRASAWRDVGVAYARNPRRNVYVYNVRGWWR